MDEKPSAPPPMAFLRRKRTLSIPRLALILLFVLASLFAIAACARWVILSYYAPRVAAEMKLLIADGGSANIADLLPQRLPGADGTPPHVLKADDFRVVNEPQLYTRLPDAGIASTKLTHEQKLMKAFEGYGAWRGMQWDPVAQEADKAGQHKTFLDWNGAWTPLLEEYLANNAAALAYITRETASASGYFDHDWQAGRNMPMPELGRVRSAACALCLDAAVKAHKGDVAGAMEDVRVGFRLRRLIDGDPVFTSKLVCFATDAITSRALKGVLATAAPDRQSVESILKELEGREEMNSLTTAFLGETAVGLAFFDDLRRDPRHARQILGGPVDDDGNYKLLATAFHALWVHTADEAAYLEAMRALRQSAAQPFPAALTLPPPPMFRDPLRVPFSVVTCSLVPAFYRSTEQAAHADARIAFVRTALALSLYRSDTGAYPETLDALVPGYLLKLQIDPFDGKPIRYQRREPGYLLYSVGEDTRDDGGTYRRDDLWEMEN